MGSTLIVDNIQGATTAANVKMPAGAILQVLQTNTTTATTISSGTRVFSDVSGLSQVITPKYSDSKVLIRCMISFFQSDHSDCGALRIMRGSTEIYGGIHSVGYSGGDNQQGNVVMIEYLDSPSTTSATTYKIQAARNYGASSASFTVNTTFDSQPTGSNITLMEIAG